MYVQRIQVEEGFLDGLNIEFNPGLNVVIGARGTGKTSLIELIRFCLGVPGHSPESKKRSNDHALSILGSGQVTVTLSDGDNQIAVTRTATDEKPRSSGGFTSPLIFSQTEIENIGLRAVGRLKILDGFIKRDKDVEIAEKDKTSFVRSVTAEAELLKKEIEELTGKLGQLPEIEKQIADIAGEEQKVAKISTAAAEKKKQLDVISSQITKLSIAASNTERSQALIERWSALVRAAVDGKPKMEAILSAFDSSNATAIRNHVSSAQGFLGQATDSISSLESEIKKLSASSNKEKLKAEEQARQLRKEIDALQSGAGSIVRKAQTLRESKAQLESIKVLTQERTTELQDLNAQRGKALDELEAIRDRRFKERSSTAKSLNTTLGPRIRIAVTRAGQFEGFAAVLADALRGSGLRYGDLSEAFAERVSPRELVEAVDNNDIDFIASAVDITKERAGRVIAHLKQADLGDIATVAVEDVVSFQLLDGSDYKDISELSTGQRCTVVLPIVLQHSDRILVVDQPEDHIDNAFVVDTLIKSIHERDETGQLIFSTHNANIPVLGNADLVIQMGSSGRQGFVVVSDKLTNEKVVSAITAIMEGGAEAFKKRASFYSGQKQK